MNASPKHFAIGLSLFLSSAAMFALGASALASDAEPPEPRLAALDADKAHVDITGDAREKARVALERSKRFRAAGDEVHAKLSDRAAAAWLSAAEDLVRTSDAEAQADTRRRAALDAGAQADRERALVEETMLQNGRLRAELDQLELSAKEPPPRTPRATTLAPDAGARAPRSGPSPAPKESNKRAGKDGGAQ
jgi:hypothetical protein